MDLIIRRKEEKKTLIKIEITKKYITITEKQEEKDSINYLFSFEFV